MPEDPPFLDRGRAQREGEVLAVDQLLPWLKEHVPGVDGVPEITQFSGGASNWTYRLRFADRDLILRRAPAGTKAKGAHDMGREFRLQKVLQPVYPLVPRMHALCADRSILGTEFYLMERIPGIILRRNLPPGLDLDEGTTRQLCVNALDALIKLHQVDWQASGLSALAKGTGYTQRQVEGWCQRYSRAKTWNVPSARKIMRWLGENLPQQERLCMTHNDFRFDNLVLDPLEPTRIIGVLDWELATIGDPLMDLGNTLTYWIQADDDPVAQGMRQQPTHLPGMLSRREVLAYYAGKTGLPVEDFAFYEVFGLFRLAGIMQQIYYRYHHGQTRNPAFRRFWLYIRYLLWRSARAIKRAS